MMVDKPKFMRLLELLLKDELVSLPPGCRITFSASISPESTAERREVQLEMRNDGPGFVARGFSRILFDPLWSAATAPRNMNPT